MAATWTPKTATTVTASTSSMSKIGGLPLAGPLLALAAAGDGLVCPSSKNHYVGEDDDTNDSHDDDDVANSGASTDIYDDVGWESAGRKIGAPLAATAKR